MTQALQQDHRRLFTLAHSIPPPNPLHSFAVWSSGLVVSLSRWSLDTGHVIADFLRIRSWTLDWTLDWMLDVRCSPPFSSLPSPFFCLLSAVFAPLRLNWRIKFPPAHLRAPRPCPTARRPLHYVLRFTFYVSRITRPLIPASLITDYFFSASVLLLPAPSHHFSPAEIILDRGLYIEADDASACGGPAKPPR
jgi:hypothetical protein